MPAPAPGLDGVPPPPPPREDDQAFVRRVRLVYMDRVNKEHEWQDLLEDPGVGTPTPGWVFSMATLLPYIACAAFTIASIFVVLMYGIKFHPRGLQEENWYWASLIGLGVIMFILEAVRINVMTIVELRRFEIRKRRKAGDFLVRRVKRDTDPDPALLQSKPKRLAAPAPVVPKVAPKFSVQRPNFLPQEGPPMPPLGPPMGIGENLPVGPPPPPPFAGSQPPGEQLPLGAPPPPPRPANQGNRPPALQGLQSSGSGTGLLPGRLDQSPSAAGRNRQQGQGAGNLTPTSQRSNQSFRSVEILSQSMNDKLRQSRSGGAPPPPPGGGGAPAPPPPAAGAPPGRAGSRPGSGRSSGGRPQKPPTPPPAGQGVQQSRAKARASQDP